MISIKLMKDTTVIGLLMFSVISDSCLSCTAAAMPPSDEESFLVYSTPEVDCEPPTNCAAWVDCQQNCEQIFWDDIESNDELSDLAGVDQFREMCVQYCDTQYILATEQVSIDSCGCGEECHRGDCSTSCTVEVEFCQ